MNHTKYTINPPEKKKKKKNPEKVFQVCSLTPIFIGVLKVFVAVFLFFGFVVAVLGREPYRTYQGPVITHW